MGSLYKGSYSFESILGAPDCWKLPVVDLWFQTESLAESGLDRETFLIGPQRPQKHKHPTSKAQDDSRNHGFVGSLCLCTLYHIPYAISHILYTIL